jgi:hypothetical protein
LLSQVSNQRLQRLDPRRLSHDQRITRVCGWLTRRRIGHSPQSFREPRTAITATWRQPPERDPRPLDLLRCEPSTPDREHRPRPPRSLRIHRLIIALGSGQASDTICRMSKSAIVGAAPAVPEHAGAEVVGVGSHLLRISGRGCRSVVLSFVIVVLPRSSGGT